MRYDVTDSSLLIWIKTLKYGNLTITDHNHDLLEMYLYPFSA